MASRYSAIACERADSETRLTTRPSCARHTRRKSHIAIKNAGIFCACIFKTVTCFRMYIDAQMFVKQVAWRHTDTHAHEPIEFLFACLFVDYWQTRRLDSATPTTAAASALCEFVCRWRLLIQQLTLMFVLLLLLLWRVRLLACAHKRSQVGFGTQRVKSTQCKSVQMSHARANARERARPTLPATPLCSCHMRRTSHDSCCQTTLIVALQRTCRSADLCARARKLNHDAQTQQRLWATTQPSARLISRANAHLIQLGVDAQSASQRPITYAVCLIRAD